MIPHECPVCEKGTVREPIGMVFHTMMYYQPVYDAQGCNTNPDRNTTSQEYQCMECKSYYVVAGNRVDGYKCYESKRAEAVKRISEAAKQRAKQREREKCIDDLGMVLEQRRWDKLSTWQRVGETLTAFFNW